MLGGGKTKQILVPLGRHQRRMWDTGGQSQGLHEVSTRYRKIHARPGQDNNLCRKPAHSRRQWSGAGVYQSEHHLRPESLREVCGKQRPFWPGPSLRDPLWLRHGTVVSPHS